MVAAAAACRLFVGEVAGAVRCAFARIFKGMGIGRVNRGKVMELIPKRSFAEGVPHSFQVKHRLVGLGGDAHADVGGFGGVSERSD